MDTESLKLEVQVRAWSHTLASEDFSNVIIKQGRAFEEFIIDGNDDSVTSRGSYWDPSPSDPLICLKFRNFQPNYVYQLLQDKLHDQVLSKQIADQIVAEAQRQTSQSSDLSHHHHPLLVMVSVKLTHKLYTFVPCNSAPSVTDLEETCPICLENLSTSDEDYCQLPSCSHCFHERCVIDWLDRSKNSCPLCRKPIYDK